MPTTSSRVSLPIVCAVVLFVGSRLFLLFDFSGSFSDVAHYARWGFQNSLASRSGKTLPQYRDELFERAMQDAARGLNPPPSPDLRLIEYPPLAIAILLIPTAFIGPLDPATYPRDYKAAFRVVIAVFDALAFIVIWWSMSRIYPRESAWQHAARLTIYTVGGFLLGHLLYDRLDIVVALAIVVSVSLLVTARRPAWSLVALAVAIHVKLVPLVLVPLFMIALLDFPALQAMPDATALRAAGRRLLLNFAWLALALVVLYVPFHVVWGTRSFDFLHFLGGRGIQIESSYASVLLALGAFGLPTKVVLEYGAADVLSPLSNGVARLAPALTLVVVLGLAADFARVSWRRAGGPFGRGSAVITYALATLVATLLTSKLFSTQYNLWLIPLVALSPLPPRARYVLFAAFIAHCALTTAIFPFSYFDHIVGMIPDPVTGDLTTNYTGPTALGKTLLMARNLLLAGLAVFLLVASRDRRSAT